MPPPPRIAQNLKNAYPKPKIDEEWLEQCCAWVAEDKNLSPTANFQEFYEAVKQQLVQSNLGDSMQAGTGLTNVATFTGHLSGPPILVQITDITEIGVSAFQLEQVRAAREERMLAGVGDEEGEEDGDVEVEGEGPMPKYPRGTLHFQLSDGASIFEGMEYRPLPQLVLGVTKLGYKLQLKGTRFSKGVAFLEPATVALVGGFSNDYDNKQLEIFKSGLYQRLGRPMPPQLDEGPGQVDATNYAPPPARAPLRDISPSSPTLHDDDIDMEPRRRLPANSSLNQNPTGLAPDERRPVKPLPARQGRNSLDSSTNTVNKRSASSTHFSGNASTSRPTPNLGFTVPPTNRQQSLNIPSPPAFSPGNKESFDFDLLDEFDNDENALPKTSSSDKGKGRAIVDNRLLSPRLTTDASSDYGMEDDDFLDPDFLENLDKIEKEAFEKATKTQIKPERRSSSFSGKPPSYIKPTDEVIEIDSSEDENKENAFVPMRHVRQRTEDRIAVGSSRGRSPTTTSQKLGVQSQKKKAMPVIDPEDVIDLSD